MSGYCGAKEEWLEPTHQLMLPEAMSDLISLSSSKWFFFDRMLTLAPVSFSHSRDARIERLILLAADQLGVDRHAFELAGQIRGGRAAGDCQKDGSGGEAGEHSGHLTSSLGQSCDARPRPAVATLHSYTKVIFTERSSCFPLSRRCGSCVYAVGNSLERHVTEDTEVDRYRAPALDKGLDILELLAGVDGGLTQAEIAKRLGRSPNEFYRMLDRLVRRGYVTKHRR